MIDDESLVKTRTNTCLSYASAIPSYSVDKTTRRIQLAILRMRMLSHT